LKKKRKKRKKGKEKKIIERKKSKWDRKNTLAIPTTSSIPGTDIE